MKDTKIHEFNPQIYPFRVWVGKQVPFEDVEKKFWLLDSEKNKCDFDRDFYGGKDNFIYATCFPVCDKESGWCGIFMLIRNTKLLDVGKIAHEASHIYDYLSDILSLECYGFANGEPRAYFIEWCTNCIYDVFKGKVK